MNLSVIIPVYNEEALIERNVERLYSFLSTQPNLENFEIVVSNNGSTDQTLERAEMCAKRHPRIRVLTLRARTLGGALRVGIQEAHYEFIMYEAIDLPFGLESIQSSLLEIAKGYDIVIRSKGHANSVIEIPFRRRLFSQMYNKLLNLIFQFHILDTQGEWIMKKTILLPYFHHLDSEGPFFQTQLFIYSSLIKPRLIEIPVVYKNPRPDSKMTLRNAFGILWNLFAELPRYFRMKYLIQNSSISVKK